MPAACNARNTNTDLITKDYKSLTQRVKPKQKFQQVSFSRQQVTTTGLKENNAQQFARTH